MSPTTFFLFTLALGTASAYALLWVLAEWLKADEEIETTEREIRVAVEKLVTTDDRNPKPVYAAKHDEAVSTTAG